MRGFTRAVNGAKLFMDHNINSIQDYIAPATLGEYEAVDVNVKEVNLFHTKMMRREIALENYLFHTELQELSPETRMEITENLRREMQEIFSGKNMY